MIKTYRLDGHGIFFSFFNTKLALRPKYCFLTSIQTALVFKEFQIRHNALACHVLHLLLSAVLLPFFENVRHIMRNSNGCGRKFLPCLQMQAYLCWPKWKWNKRMICCTFRLTNGKVLRTKQSSAALRMLTFFLRTMRFQNPWNKIFFFFNWALDRMIGSSKPLALSH